MKKRLRSIILLIAVLFTTYCGKRSNIDKEIIGKWGINGAQVYEFTSEGYFITGDPSDNYETVKYQFTAVDGQAKYWFSENPSVIIDFSYKVDGKSLELSMSGIERTVERIE